MAADKNKAKEARALAMIAPNAIKVKGENGEDDIFVATNKEENAALNMVVAAQMRAYLQSHIKRYKSMDRELTPKELKELTEAARNLAEFSGQLYESGTTLNDNSGKEEKKAEKVDSVEDISFDAVGKPETKDEPQATGADA